MRSPSTRPTPIWPSGKRNLASFIEMQNSGQRFGELANPIAVHDTRDVDFAVAAGGEQPGQALQIGDGIEVEGRLLGAITAIEVRADGAMPRRAGELANVVNVIDDRLDLATGFVRRRFAADPTRDHHPGVEGRADDCVATDQFFELIVVELSLMGHQSAAIVMAGPNGAVAEIEGFPEGFVSEMSDVEDDLQPLHFLDQLAAGCGQAARSAGAGAVSAGAIVGGTDGAESAFVRSFEIAQVDNRIGAFEGEYVADGSVGRWIVLPK